MKQSETWKNFLSALCGGTKKDEFIWKNTMLNIHETVIHGKKILTDWERDEAPMISVGGSVLQIGGVGIEDLRKDIDEQYKRLKKYRYSEATQSAQAATEAMAKSAQLENDQNFNAKIKEFLSIEGAVCGKCHEPLSERTQKIAAALGCKAVLCEKCNPYSVNLTEVDMGTIRSILLGKSK